MSSVSARIVHGLLAIDDNNGSNNQCVDLKESPLYKGSWVHVVSPVFFSLRVTGFY